MPNLPYPQVTKLLERNKEMPFKERRNIPINNQDPSTTSLSDVMQPHSTEPCRKHTRYKQHGGDIIAACRRGGLPPNVRVTYL